MAAAARLGHLVLAAGVLHQQEGDRRRLHAEVADLVKEQRAVPSSSNNPRIVPIRTRERATLKAKEMALDKITVFPVAVVCALMGTPAMVRTPLGISSMYTPG